MRSALVGRIPPRLQWRAAEEARAARGVEKEGRKIWASSEGFRVSEYVSKKLGGRKIDRRRKYLLFDTAAELRTPEEQTYFLKLSRTYSRDTGRVTASYLFHAMRTVMRARGMHPRRPKNGLNKQPKRCIDV